MCINDHNIHFFFTFSRFHICNSINLCRSFKQWVPGLLFYPCDTSWYILLCIYVFIPIYKWLTLLFKYIFYINNFFFVICTKGSMVHRKYWKKLISTLGRLFVEGQGCGSGRIQMCFDGRIRTRYFLESRIRIRVKSTRVRHPTLIYNTSTILTFVSKEFIKGWILLGQT